MWGLLAFVIGLLYGWLSPGRQNKGQMLKTGLIIGIVLALVLGLIGYAANSNPVGFGSGILGIFLSVLIITIVFVLGVWIGDLIEGATRGRQRTA